MINLLSMLLIICGVFCVSIKEEQNSEINYDYVLIAVIFALSTGFCFATSTLLMKYMLANAGFTPTRFNIDGLMASGIIMFILFLIENSR